jgi:superfamily II DNA/RNA helicase
LRSGEVRLLIATDVASRGIDIKDITHILNFDFPRHAEEYVHRVGRTGRAGRTGQALSFMTREDWSKAPDLINILEEANQVRTYIRQVRRCNCSSVFVLCRKYLKSYGKWPIVTLLGKFEKTKRSYVTISTADGVEVEVGVVSM